MKKVTLSLLILAFVASSMTLWLLESPLKPMLYFFEAALILMIYYPVSGNLKKISFETKGKVIKHYAQRGLRYSFREEA